MNLENLTIEELKIKIKRHRTFSEVRVCTFFKILKEIEEYN